ncbi:hypothetical protein BSK59_12975 [Paenibacillus odorifer]|uniref:hypothetical protein n=1 Tax=Paenibacillus odorifer TaxID=189426 RepID=UPI00096D7923|nr:hypothetical protein [Paenibacillus odorifer]OME55387.1 hypothetical protein BSK59_12975 [Paenibacillus odorifer]
MSRLKELTEFKNTIIQRIVSNQDILKAVYYRDQNFLNQPNVDNESVLYKNIFPYNFIPSSPEEVGQVKTYITLSITDYKPVGGSRFRAGSVYIYTFSHKSLFKVDLPTGDLRVDFIVAGLDEMLSDKRGIGIGELEFVGMKEYIVNQDYQGYVLHYRPVMKS